MSSNYCPGCGVSLDHVQTRIVNKDGREVELCLDCSFAEIFVEGDFFDDDNQKVYFPEN